MDGLINKIEYIGYTLWYLICLVPQKYKTFSVVPTTVKVAPAEISVISFSAIAFTMYGFPPPECVCPLPSWASIFLPIVTAFPCSVRQTVWSGPMATSTIK